MQRGQRALSFRLKRQDFLKEIAKKLNISHWEQWYDVTKEDFAKLDANGILKGNSISKLLKTTYPDLPWKDYLFERKPREFWKDEKNQREFVLNLASILGIKNWPDDWYAIDSKQFRDAGGYRLLMLYNGKVYSILYKLFPQYTWDVFAFKKIRKGYWENIQFQAKFLAKLEKELNISKPEDWYSLSQREIIKRGGSALIKRYGSFRKVLRTFYPNFDWKEESFLRVPKQHWDSEENKFKFLNQLAEKLKVNSANNFVAIDKKDIIHHGGRSLLDRMKVEDIAQMGSFSNVRFGRKSQTRLFQFFVKLFSPKYDVYSDYPLADIIPFEKEVKLELDVWIPGIRLGVEYQGDQHYKSSNIMFQNYLFANDETKRKLCEESGITLIRIPFWWDRSFESLIGTLIEHGIHPPGFENNSKEYKPIPNIPDNTNLGKPSNLQRKKSLSRYE